MPDPILEQVVVDNSQEKPSSPEDRVDRGKPYYYHTAPIEALGDIFSSKRLKSPEGKPIMMTGDKVDETSGEVRANGLNDPSYDILAKRKFEPGKVIFVFDKRVKENPSFEDVSAERRYPQVAEQTTDTSLAVLAFEEDMPQVWQKMQVAKTDIPIVRKEDWEQYAYSDTPGELVEEIVDDVPKSDDQGQLMEVQTEDREEVVGGLVDPEAVVESVEESSDMVKKINETPGYLLTIDSISVEDLFKLDWDKVFGKLHTLGSLPSDHPSLIRWMKIREIRENGKDDFVKNNPETKVIELE